MADDDLLPDSKVQKRLRILILAEAANPEFVSVPLVGWSLANALRAHADVHLVTQIRNRDAILRAGLIEGEDFTVIDTEAVARPALKLARLLRMGENKGWTIVTAMQTLTYPWFEKKVWALFGDRIKGGAYDIVHRITPLSPTSNSPIAAKCARAGVPFVVGPLNGGIPWPPGFEAERKKEREWLSYVRGAYKLMPGRAGSLKNTARIIVGSRHTESEIPEKYRSRCVWVPENAIDPERFNKTVTDDPSAPLRVSFIGRLVPYKGPDMLIEGALPLLREGKINLQIIGDGPMMPELRECVAREGVEDAVTFHGWLEHRSVQEVASTCPVMALPSIREFGGGVVLEAMALRSVPIVIDYGGPGELVDETVGFKIPIGDRAAVIKGIQNALESALELRGKLPEIGQRARARVEETFTWDAKARQVVETYQDIT